MITSKMINESKAQLLDAWGSSSEKIIAECEKLPSLAMTSDEFTSHCVPCGGNWGGMLLTGIKALRPTVWDLIPEDLGVFAWGNLCSVLILCGVDTSAR